MFAIIIMYANNLIIEVIFAYFLFDSFALARSEQAVFSVVVSDINFIAKLGDHYEMYEQGDFRFSFAVQAYLQ